MNLFEMKLNSAYHHLIGKQSEEILRKLVRKFKKHAQNLKGDCLLLGDDSGLKNAWDEICVDLQGEWTVFHSVFLSFIEQYTSDILFNALTELEKTILWTQTREFEDWLKEIEENSNETVQYSIDFFNTRYDDAVKELISDAILTEAMDYTNSRVEKYLYVR